MNKKQKAALFLAGTLALNTLPACANQNDNNANEVNHVVEEQTKQYETDKLYVVISESMDGETVLYIANIYRYLYFETNEVLTNSKLIYKHLQEISKNNVYVKLFEYLNIDEMKEYLSEEELISIYKRLQTELNSSKEEKLKLSKTESSNAEKTFNINKIMISEISKSSDEESELYIIDRNGKEIFTNHQCSSYSYSTSYNIIDFIEIEDYKEEYTESELKEILEYARARYHKMNSDNSLKLTK